MNSFFRFDNLVWASLLCAASFAVADSLQTTIKYSQIFADKKIILTERLSWLDYWTTRNKKGFIKFEN